MINLQTKKVYTKEDLIAKGNVVWGGTQKGSYMNTDGIRYDLDGQGMAEFLESIGFEIVSYKDMKTNGIVITKEGLHVSTNGYCRMK